MKTLIDVFLLMEEVDLNDIGKMFASSQLVFLLMEEVDLNTLHMIGSFPSMGLPPYGGSGFKF